MKGIGGDCDAVMGVGCDTSRGLRRGMWDNARQSGLHPRHARWIVVDLH